MEKIRIGPEDLGKRVLIIPLNIIGIITSFTSEWVAVLTSRDRSSKRYGRDQVKYYLPDIKW